MRLDIEIYKEDGLHCAFIGDDCGGSGIEVKADNYDDFAKEIGLYIADYAFQMDEVSYDIYEECWGILSQCVANEQISADDDLEDNMYELLEFVEGYENMDEDTISQYEKGMREVWRDFDEW